MTNATDQRDALERRIREAQEAVAWWPDDVRIAMCLPTLGAEHPVEKLKAELTQLRQALAEAERRLDNEKKPCCQQFETCKERCWPLICNLRVQLSTAQAELAIAAATMADLEVIKESAKAAGRLAQHQADAERYRWLKKNRDVMLLTSFFGNGCVNRRIEEVEAAIDAALSTHPRKETGKC